MYPLLSEIELGLLRALLTRSQKTVLVTHVNPDGDAIGSLQGLAGFLRALGKDVQTVAPTPYPDFLAFLDRDPQHKVWIYKHDPKACIRVLEAADAVFCVDANMLDRLDAAGNVVRRLSQPKVLIDHHPEPATGAFDIVFSTPAASSTCELIYRLIVQLQMLRDFPPAAAEPLYVGMMTDTNNFSNSVTAETFEAGAALLRMGVRKEEVQQQVFGMFSERRMRLMAHTVFSRMVLVRQYRAAYMALSLAEQVQYGFRPGDTEGFVNIPLNISDMDLSMLFVETPEFIRVSLRSRNNIDVNDMAKRFFNGGGHRLASGGRLHIPFSELPGAVLQALEAMFGAPPHPVLAR